MQRCSMPHAQLGDGSPQDFVAGLGVVRRAASNQWISGHRSESLLFVGEETPALRVRDLRFRIRRRNVVSVGIVFSSRVRGVVAPSCELSLYLLRSFQSHLEGRPTSATCASHRPAPGSNSGTVDGPRCRGPSPSYVFRRTPPSRVSIIYVHPRLLGLFRNAARNCLFKDATPMTPR
jgi:hypothetical protein